MARAKISDSKEQSRQQQYNSMVERIRNSRTAGAGHEVDSMLLVLELEDRPSLWQTALVTDFEEVVRAERFCTVARWRAFKAARGFIPRKHLSALGVPAACLIAIQPKRMQLKLLNLALTFRRENGVEPTYQYITQLLPKRARVAGPNRKDLLRYIEVLKGVIQKLGKRVPTMEAP
jgi:hypothetical protein